MNIKNFLSNLVKPDEKKYTGSFRRSAAITIDMWIVLFLRVLVMNLLGKLWLEEKFITFHREFTERFGTESVKNTPEHIEFITHSSAFHCALAFYAIVILIGAFYHAYFNSSAWHGTIGKRLMKVIIVREGNEGRISFLNGFMHYFLSIMPFAFIIYLISYKLRYHLDFYQVITASELNVFLSILFAVWVQTQFFTRKKTTVYDMICGTVLLNGRTTAKFPWSK